VSLKGRLANFGIKYSFYSFFLNSFPKHLLKFFNVTIPFIFNVLLKLCNSFSELIIESDNKRIASSSQYLVNNLNAEVNSWIKRMESCFNIKDLKCINSKLDQGTNLKTKIDEAISSIKHKLIRETEIQVNENNRRTMSFGGLLGTVFFVILEFFNWRVRRCFVADFLC